MKRAGTERLWWVPGVRPGSAHCTPPGLVRPQPLWATWPSAQPHFKARISSQDLIETCPPSASGNSPCPVPEGPGKSPCAAFRWPSPDGYWGAAGMCPLSCTSSLLKSHHLVIGDTAECRTFGSLRPGRQGAEQWKPRAAGDITKARARGSCGSCRRRDDRRQAQRGLPSCFPVASLWVPFGRLHWKPPRIFCSHQSNSRKRWLPLALGPTCLPARPTERQRLLSWSPLLSPQPAAGRRSSGCWRSVASDLLSMARDLQLQLPRGRRSPEALSCAQCGNDPPSFCSLGFCCLEREQLGEGSKDFLNGLSRVSSSAL